VFTYVRDTCKGLTHTACNDHRYLCLHTGTRCRTVLYSKWKSSD